MSLFDFFFPQQAQATHLRELVDRSRRDARRATMTTGELETRIASLEDDLGYVTLILGSILDALDDKGVVTRDDLKASLTQLDGLDGVADGKLDVNILKGRHL